MDVISFECRNCGAPLIIPPNAVVVTCNHCKGQHKITYSEENITAELIHRAVEHEGRIREFDQETADQAEANEIRLRLYNIDLGRNLLHGVCEAENEDQKNESVKQAVEAAVKGYGETHRAKVKSYFGNFAGVKLTNRALSVGCVGIIVLGGLFTIVMSSLPRARTADDVVGHVVIAVSVLGIGLVVLNVIFRQTNKFQSKVEAEQVRQELDKVENEVKSKLRALTGQKKTRDNQACIVSVGDICKGKVVRTEDFGVFVQLTEDVEGLCPISELSTGYVKNVEDVCKVGDVIAIKVLSINESGRFKLSRKAALAELERKRS